MDGDMFVWADQPREFFYCAKHGREKVIRPIGVAGCVGSHCVECRAEREARFGKPDNHLGAVDA